jgi:pyridoxamine 5'-phosphate oxidase
VIADRGVLEQRLADVTARFPEGSVVPRPPYWGGFRVVPSWIEFWHHRDDRLHDRIRYRRGSDGDAWVRERLSP